MSKKLIPIVMTILVMLLASSVFAGPMEKGPNSNGPGMDAPPMMKHPGGKMMGGGHHDMMGPDCGMFFEIGLDDKQIEKIMTLKHKRQVKLIPVHRELRDLAEEARTLREDPVTNKNRLIAITERTGELKTQLKVSHIEGRAEMLSVLTDDQKTLLEEKKDEMKDRMPGKRGPGFGKGMPGDFGPGPDGE